jgi:hypothetical protein
MPLVSSAWASDLGDEGVICELSSYGFMALSYLYVVEVRIYVWGFRVLWVLRIYLDNLTGK